MFWKVTFTGRIGLLRELPATIEVLVVSYWKGDALVKAERFVPFIHDRMFMVESYNPANDPDAALQMARRARAAFCTYAVDYERVSDADFKLCIGEYEIVRQALNKEIG